MEELSRFQFDVRAPMVKSIMHAHLVSAVACLNRLIDLPALVLRFQFSHELKGEAWDLTC
jgi:hypothetical protein